MKSDVFLREHGAGGLSTQTAVRGCGAGQALLVCPCPPGNCGLWLCVGSTAEVSSVPQSPAPGHARAGGSEGGELGVGSGVWGVRCQE